MKRMCACCGGGNFLRGITLMDKMERGERPLLVRADRDPDALIFKGSERVGVESEVCDDCGHLQLYIDVVGRETLKSALSDSGKLAGDSPMNMKITICVNCHKAHGLLDCPHCGYMSVEE